MSLNKHGIDFIDAIAIFDDLDRIELEIERNFEKRRITIGQMNGIIAFLVYVKRENNHRIISVRRASRNERKIYENAKKGN